MTYPLWPFGMRVIYITPSECHTCEARESFHRFQSLELGELEDAGKLALDGEDAGGTEDTGDGRSDEPKKVRVLS